MKLCWEAMEGTPGSCVRGPLTVLVFYFGPDVLLEHGHDDTGELGGISWHYLEHTFCCQV